VQQGTGKITEAMKKIIPLIFTLCIVQIGYSQIEKRERKVIIIDPGHGGLDSGAISEDGLQEKDIVLDIAHLMLYWNKTLLDDRYDIYLTRNRDTLISLGDRTKLAQYLKPDIFISLHCNHAKDSNVKGIELYTHGSNKLSLLYAETISNELNQKLGFKIREPRQADFQVLRETKGSCPAILLELGYLSNAHESEYLKSKEKRKALALAILIVI
jgi:N-acetylmuramoyl-L-alanine amidase